ncbi:MAG: DUF932 domain-containing protein [Planctomycetes bacterium]|nr:DUF932 domain-containing protein [Planctomycetota bacterium]
MVDVAHGSGETGGGRVRVEPRVTTLGSLRITAAAPETAKRQRETLLPEKALLDVDGQKCVVTPRFWKSVFARYRFGASTFRYFRPEEVFGRICEVSRDDRLRVMVELPPSGPPQALAVSDPRQPLVTIDDMRDLVRSHGAERPFYRDGVIGCTFMPKSGERGLAIGADEFANRFTLDVPIDGFGSPRIHVALLRLICTNGLVGHHRAFASDVPASRNPLHTLKRAIECFDHADGYAAIRERFLAAQTSWASVREAHALHRQIVKAKLIDPAGKGRVIESFDRLTGRIQEFYGVTNVDTLPPRRQRLLPVKCRVYDLLNLASEVATHSAAPREAVAIQHWIGSTLADEFDLEGTAEIATEFADLLVDGRADPTGAGRDTP